MSESRPMSDSRPTIDEQPGSPGAHAPGDSSRRPPEGEHALASAEASPESRPSQPDAGEEGAPSDGDGELTELEGELDELVRATAQRDEYLALAQRTQADFENYRKRVAREAANAQGRGVASLAKELLPALDNLDRALEAAAQDDPLLEGVRLVRSELLDGLARAGVESFSPLGESFDPALHEAMATQLLDGADGGTVVEVYQPGYRLGSSIIRPARVLVAA